MQNAEYQLPIVYLDPISVNLAQTLTLFARRDIFFQSLLFESIE